MSKRVPKYRRHPNGQDFVQHQSIDTPGHRMYLGVYGTAKSRARYRQFLEQLEAQQDDEQLDLTRHHDLTITELVAAYLQHCETYYVDSLGRNTKEFSGSKEAVAPVLTLFGEDLARDFGPRKLMAVQQRFVALGYSRGVVNQHIGRVKRMFKWASKTEIVPAIVYHGLLCVDGLRQGRTKAPDYPEVEPVAWEHAKAVLPYVAPPVAAMIQVQYLCGMRPGAVTIMRRCDLDTSDEIWIYSPERHKNKWRGHALVKAIPKAAQSIITDFFKPELDAYLFSPNDSHAWHMERRANAKPNRNTPIYPCERKRRERSRQRNARKTPRYRDHYDTRSYHQAIQYGIDKANEAELNVPHWSPNQLRLQHRHQHIQ